jgi:hypothetical protein
MATIALFNHSTKVLANSEVNIASLKVMLVGAGYTFDPFDSNMNYIDNNEVWGNGWPAGGQAVAGAAITTTGVNDAMLDANDISVTASGGTIGPATGAVLYEADSPGGLPLAYIDFQGSESAGNGTNFNISWNASGIITWTYT